MKILEKAKGFLLHPNDAFSKEKNTTLDEAFKYMLLLLIIYSVLAATIEYIRVTSLPTASLSLVPYPILFLSYITVTLFLFLIGGLIIHVFAYIAGARKGLNQTLKAVFYSGTPSYMFSWVINIVGVFLGVSSLWLFITFVVWGSILLVKGLKSLQEMTAGRATAAVLIPIISAIILLAGAAYTNLSPPDTLQSKVLQMYDFSCTDTGAVITFKNIGARTITLCSNVNGAEKQATTCSDVTITKTSGGPLAATFDKTLINPGEAVNFIDSCAAGTNCSYRFIVAGTALDAITPTIQC